MTSAHMAGTSLSFFMPPSELNNELNFAERVVWNLLYAHGATSLGLYGHCATGLRPVIQVTPLNLHT